MFWLRYAGIVLWPSSYLFIYFQQFIVSLSIFCCKYFLVFVLRNRFTYFLTYLLLTINCIKHCVRREFIQNSLKIFSFFLVWVKNLESHTSWTVAKRLRIRHCLLECSTICNLKLSTKNWDHSKEDYKHKVLTKQKPEINKI